ncbi:MAG TPA: DUF1501 domain-containing protein [Vicinamibacterales bacterium]|jgi:hypothetical protein|nr:DUF1501 domain-containing protein [Vicinamibacterales bacterium]
MNRRQFIQAGIATTAGAAVAPFARAEERKPPSLLPPRADAIIYIWLPGGIAQTDTWDPKAFTPFRPGMKGSELLGTCASIPTKADGIVLGEGLESIASVMDKGAIVRSLISDTKFGAIHLKAQYYANTGYLFPAGVKVPSLGAVVGRTLGRRHDDVPPYIYIGRDIDTSDEEKLFISEYIGPGFYGVRHAPFMIPDPAKGVATLNAIAGMRPDRLDRRQAYLRAITGLAEPELRDANRVKDYVQVMEDARAMMESPVKRAFDMVREESPATLAAYQPQVSPADVQDRTYYYGNRFGNGLLLARRLVERGARFVQVEYQYGPFKGFDMHENGRSRMVEMKRQIDRPIAQLVRDLDERGLLDRTLVVVATEFGRTIAARPAAGTEPDGFAERHTGDDLALENERMYGFHGHFSSANCMLLFGGGSRGGLAYGRTADRHPMVPVEQPVRLIDLHATIYRLLGIPADMWYETEGRPFYATKDGKGQVIQALIA